MLRLPLLLLFLVFEYTLFAQKIITPIIVNGAFTVQIDTTGTACASANGSVTATASNGVAPYTYNLSGRTSLTGSFTSLAGGGYTLTVTDATSATVVANVLVSNPVQPTLTLSGGTDPTPCTGQNGVLTLIAGGGAPPYWYSKDGINFQSSNAFYNLPGGIYEFRVEDANGCIGYSTFSWDFGSCGGIGLGGSWGYYACNKNGNINAIGFGGTPPYTYSLDNVNYQASGNFYNLNAGTYTIYIKDAAGNKLIRAIQIWPDCGITIAANATAASCQKSDGELTVNGYGGTPRYTYSLDGINYQSSNIFTGLAAGEYTVYVMDATATAASESGIIVPQGSCLVITCTETDATCNLANGSATAIASNGTGPYTYSIDGINFSATNVFSGLAPGNYTISAKDATGLTNSTSIAINAIPSPNIVLIAQPTSCDNTSGVITATGAGGARPYTYSLGSGSFQADSVYGQLSIGSYAVTLKDADGCTSAQTANIQLNNTLTVSAGPDITICQGQDAALAASSNGTSFSWTPSTGLNNSNILNPWASPSATTAYQLTATSGVCSQTAGVTVYVNPAPIPNAGGDVSVCYGKSVQLGGSGGVLYSWSPATYLDNTQIADPTVQTPESSITYYLNTTDALGCTSLQPASVAVSVIPPLQIFAGNDTSIAIGQPLQLFATDDQSVMLSGFVWSPAEGLDNAYIQNPVATLSQDMTYTITASTPGGCEGTGQVQIKVYKGPDIYVPSAFTPNGDGTNDILRALPIGIKEFRYFTIYNRWGSRIFYTSDPNTGWDGTVNGRMQQGAAYVWMALGIDYNGNVVKRQGTVVLMR